MKRLLLVVALAGLVGVPVTFADDAPAESKVVRKGGSPADKKKVMKKDDAPAEGKTAKTAKTAKDAKPAGAAVKKDKQQ